jgi:ribonuclease-3 family protein
MDIYEDLITKSENEINRMSPLTWAYVGDAVYEEYIRIYLANNTNLNPHNMHVISIKYVKAENQAKVLEEIIDTKFLTEEEIEIAKRGRNVQNHHIPKHASLKDYSYSTAFEAVIGYLYLLKKNERVKEIIDKCLDILGKDNK